MEPTIGIRITADRSATRGVQQRGTYYVLTGERGSGKTLACKDLATEARTRGVDVAGILTVRSGSELHDGREVMDLRTSARRPFGSQAHGGTDPLTPGWHYESEVFDWATQVLSVATPCGLLIVDEVGPLELLGKRGWVYALDVLRGREFGAALVVCRPTLLDELEAVLGRPPAGLFTASLDQRGTLPGVILAEVFAAPIHR
jgi:hypothetical protein